jgi:hypothetical protein
MATRAPEQKKDKRRKKEAYSAFEGILQRTVTEMITDLAKIDKENSMKLSDLVSQLSGRKLIAQLENSQSPLINMIPKEQLEKDAAGRRYLEILALVQPLLQPVGRELLGTRKEKKRRGTSSQVLERKGEKSDKKVAVADAGVDADADADADAYAGVEMRSPDKSDMSDMFPLLDMPELPEGFVPPGVSPEIAKALFSAIKNLAQGRQKNSSLVKLLQSAIVEMDLKNRKQEDLGNIQSIMSMMMEFNTFLQKKVAEKEIDMGHLEQEAKDLCNDLQNSPEIAKLMADPQFAEMAAKASMMANMVNSGSDDDSSPMSAMSAMSVMSGLGDFADLANAFM